jgi:hypothetical protein
VGPRDVGYALAARLLGGEEAAALCAAAPRGAAESIAELLQSDAATLGAQAQRFQQRPAAALEELHPSWLATSLAEVSQPMLDAVVRSLSAEARTSVLTHLATHRRTSKEGASASPLRLAFDAEMIEAFRRSAFPELGMPVQAPAQKELAWLFTTTGAALLKVAHECGLQVVARAFSRIARQELARLCQGLRPQDSVRLVSTIVSLVESHQDPQALRRLQATYLLLLKTTGISHDLLDRAGLAFLGAALVSRLDDPARRTLCFKLPIDIGRRLLDVSAEGALPPASAVEVYRRDVTGFLDAAGVK